MDEGKIPNFIFSGFSSYWQQWKWRKRILFILGFGSMWLIPVVFALSTADIDMWKDFKNGTIPIEGTVMRVWYDKVGGPTSGGIAGPFARVIYNIDGNEYEKTFEIEQKDFKQFRKRQDFRGEGWLGTLDLVYSPRNIDWVAVTTDLPPRENAIAFAVIWFIIILYAPLFGKIILKLMLLLVPKDKR